MIDRSISGVSARMRSPEIRGGMTYEAHEPQGFEQDSEIPQAVQAAQR